MSVSNLKSTQSTADETSMAHSTYSGASTMKMSKGEIEDLREAFRLFDADDKGVISFHELKEIAESLSQENTSKDSSFSTQSYRLLNEILNRVKNEEDDMELDEDGFIELFSQRPEDEIGDEFQRVFDLFDRKGKGYLNVDDLRHVSEELGESMTDEELEEMIAKAAPSNGKVSPEDFQKIMTKKLFS